MEDDCILELSGDISRDCLENNIGGIEVNVLLINEQDINRSLTTFSPQNPLIVTNLVLKTGKTAFLLKGVKQVNALKFELVPKELSDDMFKHTMSGIIPNASAENKLRLLELSKSKVIAVVEGKFKGILNKDAFQIGGYYSGLKLATSTYATNENDGTIAFELTSADTYEEPTPTLTLLETDYATTLTAYNNKFATEPA